MERITRPRRRALRRLERPRQLGQTSSGLAVAVPTLPTTTPAAAFAITTASGQRAAGESRQGQRGDRGIARALHVEDLEGRAGDVDAGLPDSKIDMPCPPRVTITSAPPSWRCSFAAARASSAGLRTWTPESSSSSRRFGFTSEAPR